MQDIKDGLLREEALENSIQDKDKQMIQQQA